MAGSRGPNGWLGPASYGVNAGPITQLGYWVSLDVEAALCRQLARQTRHYKSQTDPLPLLSLTIFVIQEILRRKPSICPAELANLRLILHVLKIPDPVFSITCPVRS